MPLRHASAAARYAWTPPVRRDRIPRLQPLAYALDRAMRRGPAAAARESGAASGEARTARRTSPRDAPRDGGVERARRGHDVSGAASAPTASAHRASCARAGVYACSGRSSRPHSAASRTAGIVLALALELGGRVGVHVGGRAHLVGVPQRPGHVHALEPGHAVEVLADEHDHVLGPALALRAGAAQVSDARAAEQRAIERPPVRDPAHIALELAVVELVEGRHPPPIVADAATGGKPAL